MVCLGEVMNFKDVVAEGIQRVKDFWKSAGNAAEKSELKGIVRGCQAEI